VRVTDVSFSDVLLGRKHAVKMHTPQKQFGQGVVPLERHRQRFAAGHPNAIACSTLSNTKKTTTVDLDNTSKVERM
jgi:hypothetical protein